MSIVTRIQAAASAFRIGENWWQALVLEGLRSGGKPGKWVTEKNALKYSPVFACINLASETLSTLPLGVFEKDKDGNRKVRRDLSIYKVLHDKANPCMTAQIFREIMQWNCEQRGVALAQKIRNIRGELIELWPFDPDGVEEYYADAKTGKLNFKMKKSGKLYTQDEIFYFFGPGSNGIEPKSRIKLAAESLGIGMSAEEYGNKFFSQGTNVGGFLKHPKGLKQEAYDRLKAEMNKQYSGLGNAHKLILLEEGLDFQAAGVTNEDAQFLETRRFQVEEVCRWFGMKPHMIADLSHATFSNIEHQGIEAVRYTWRPRCVRLEQAIDMQLLPKGLYAEHNLDGLMRGDLPSQVTAWHSLLQDGVLNADEVRKMMNLNPQEGGQGKIYYMPLNMIDKSTVQSSPEPDNTPEPTNPPEEKSISLPGDLRREQRKSIDARRNISTAYLGIYRTTTEKVVSADIQNIKTKMAETSAEEFLVYINTEYEAETKPIVKTNSAPMITSFSEDLKAVLEDEVDDIDSVRYEKYISEYIDQFATRYAFRSKRQLRKIVRDNDEYEDLVEERLLEWAETRADKISLEETTRQRGAFTKGAYATAGITLIRWVAHGKSCPFCNQLDGTIIGISQSFISVGQSLSADDRDPLTVSSDIGHAPVHAGCDCDIVAEG